ncbi:Uncharacterised protein [Mycobacteroides abscessus subsp. abscessus]|nr:Uncharacterised protein [Mycobacteroides abscessus subsp. abscessus]
MTSPVCTCAGSAVRATTSVPGGMCGRIDDVMMVYGVAPARRGTTTTAANNPTAMNRKSQLSVSLIMSSGPESESPFWSEPGSSAAWRSVEDDSTRDECLPLVMDIVLSACVSDTAWSDMGD